MTNPSVTIGIATYRRPEFLRQALGSVLNQVYRDFEVVVCNDDAENPLSAADLGFSDPRIRIVNQPRNLGQQDNMNSALDHARAPRFTWLNDDDLHRADYLAEVFRVFSERPGTSAVFTGYFEFRELASDSLASSLCPPAVTMRGTEFLARVLERRYRVIGCYGVFETEYLRKTGGIPKLIGNRPIYSDALMTLETARFPKVGYIDAPLVGYRFHDNSYSLVSKDTRYFIASQEEYVRRGLAVLADERDSPLAARLREFLLLHCTQDIRSTFERSALSELTVFPNYAAKMLRVFAKSPVAFRARALWELAKAPPAVLKRKIGKRAKKAIGGT